MHEWANASVVFLTGEKDKRKIKKLNARIYLMKKEIWIVKYVRNGEKY